MALNKLALATTWLALLAAPFLIVCLFLSHRFGLVGSAVSVIVLEATFATTTLVMALRSLDMRLSDLVAGIRRPPLELLTREFALLRYRFLRPAELN